MTYQWKVPGIYPVDAQTAGEELSRIYSKKGAVTPADIVSESRSITAPLHPCFEWNDVVAAEKYREAQASNIIRCITTQVQTDDGQSVPVRAFVTVGNDYEPIAVVIKAPEKMDALLQRAIRELHSFQIKYNTLSALAPVFDAINALASKGANYDC